MAQLGSAGTSKKFANPNKISIFFSNHLQYKNSQIWRIVLNKLSKTLLITFFGLFSINPSYAFDVFSLESDTTNNVLKVYGVDLRTKEKTLLTKKNLGGSDPSSAGRNSYVNPNSEELVIITNESGQEAYNWKTYTWRTIDESLFPDAPHILQVPSASGNGSFEVYSQRFFL